MASVAVPLFACDNGLASGSLAYGDATHAWQSVSLVNDRGGGPTLGVYIVSVSSAVA